MNIHYGCAILRPIEDKDFDLLYFMINDPITEFFAGGWNFPVSSNQQKEYIHTFRNGDKGIKLMIELTNGKTIGMVVAGPFDWKNRKTEVGWKTFASFEDRMKNDTFDAAIALLNYLFNELGMNCVYGTLMEENFFAQKLLRKLRFSIDGVLRERLFKSGKYHNMIAVSLLRSEFNSFINQLNN